MRRIRFLALERGLTGRELAKRSNLDPSKISALQLGRYTPAPGSLELRRVAIALGVPASEAESLLEDVREPEAATKPEEAATA